jgi:hypothetical protein
MMKKQAVSYAIIRFQPHVETEEFANVGIVLVAPRMSYFDFRLETRRLARVTAFFDNLEPALVRDMLRNYDLELRRIRDLAGHKGDGQTRFEFETRDNAEHLFNALTKDREGVIRFSDVRFAMSAEPKVMIDELFDHYVRRSFVNGVYREGLLEKNIRNLLRLDAAGRTFKPRDFTDGLYSARFPFVEVNDDQAVRVLKPIFLGQDDPTRILDHGNKWAFTINRLRKVLPRDVVLAVEGPDGSGTQHRAFTEAVDLFKNNGIHVVDAHDQQQLLRAMH